MGNSDFTWFFRMLELVMVSSGMMENPTFLLQPLYYFPTFHYAYYTHSRLIINDVMRACWRNYFLDNDTIIDTISL